MTMMTSMALMARMDVTTIIEMATIMVMREMTRKMMLILVPMLNKMGTNQKPTQPMMQSCGRDQNHRKCNQVTSPDWPTNQNIEFYFSLSTWLNTKL